MKVKELISLLQKENPEHEIIIQQDLDGTEHSFLASVENAMYIEETGYYGEQFINVFFKEKNKNLIILTEEEFELLKNNPKAQCVVLSITYDKNS